MCVCVYHERTHVVERFEAEIELTAVSDVALSLCIARKELLEDGEVVHSPSGITFLIPPAVTEQKIKPTAQLVTDLTSTDLQSLKNQLQPGEVVFQPVFRLSPEENQSD